MLFFDDNNFSFGYAGELVTEEPYIHVRRVLKKSFEIIYVTKGILYMEEDGIKYELTPNQILVLEQGKFQGGYKVHEGGTAFYWMHYHTDNLPIPLKLYTGDEYHEVKSLFKKLLHVYSTHTYGKCAKDALALCIYEELKKISKSEKSFPPIINKITEYVKRNLEKKLTVSSIANKFGYNPDYLSRVFYNATGITLKEHIIDTKLKEAKNYLLTTDLPLKQIAGKLGFEDENLFIKFFSYHEKQAPTACRNSYFNSRILNK